MAQRVGSNGNIFATRACPNCRGKGKLKKTVVNQKTQLYEEIFVSCQYCWGDGWEWYDTGEKAVAPTKEQEPFADYMNKRGKSQK